MAERNIDTASVATLIRAVGQCEDYSFLIGAGTSRPPPAEIPTGGELIETWQKECYKYVNSKGGLEAWVKNKEEKEKKDEESAYGFWFKECHPTRGGRKEYIKELVKDKEPNFAHVLLATMMEEDYVPHVLTPNFDDLLFDAFYLYLEDKPQVIDHRAVAPEFRLTHSESAIVKLHGDYLYDNLRNTASETRGKALDDGMKEALQQTAEEYGLVVVGYSGGDDSIMDPLIEANLSEYGIYWCVRDLDSFPKAEKAEELLEQPNTYLVEIEGFGSLMRKFGSRIDDIEPPQPDEVIERAEERADMLKGALKESKEAATDEEEEEYVDKTEKMWEGKNLIQEDKYDEAIELLNEVIEEDPDYAQAYSSRGIAKHGLEEYTGAVADYDTAIKSGLEEPYIYYNRGIAKDKLEEHEAAIADYDTAIKQGHDNAETYFNRGNAKRALGDYEAAIADYDTAIELDPDSAYRYSTRGRVKAVLDKYEAAIADYDTAIELDPDHAQAYLNRGLAKHELDEYEAAVTDYDTAIELDPDHAQAYLNRGLAKHELDEYEAAVTDYDTAIELNPNHAQAYLNRGLTKEELGECEAAIADYDTVIELDPENSYAYNNRGFAKYKLGKHESAVADYDVAIQHASDTIPYLNSRAEIRLQMGAVEQAHQDARKAKKMSESIANSALSLLIYIISGVALGENKNDEESKYRNLCEDEFTILWSFEELDLWLEEANLEPEKKDKIAELIDLLRDHNETLSKPLPT